MYCAWNIPFALLYIFGRFFIEICACVLYFKLWRKIHKASGTTGGIICWFIPIVSYVFLGNWLFSHTTHFLLCFTWFIHLLHFHLFCNWTSLTFKMFLSMFKCGYYYINLKVVLRRKIFVFPFDIFLLKFIQWVHNYINRYNLKRYKPPESRNTCLKTVENPAAITQFAKVEPVIILESGLTRETCRVVSWRHIRNEDRGHFLDNSDRSH